MTGLTNREWRYVNKFTDEVRERCINIMCNSFMEMYDEIELSKDKYENELGIIPEWKKAYVKSISEQDFIENVVALAQRKTNLKLNKETDTD